MELAFYGVAIQFVSHGDSLNFLKLYIYIYIIYIYIYIYIYIKVNRFANESEFGIYVFIILIYLCSTRVSDFIVFCRRLIMVRLFFGLVWFGFMAYQQLSVI